MFCAKCGKEIQNKTVKFCPKCGMAVRQITSFQDVENTYIRKKMHQRWLIAVGTALLIIFGIVGCFFYSRFNTNKNMISQTNNQPAALNDELPAKDNNPQIFKQINSTTHQVIVVSPEAGIKVKVSLWENIDGIWKNSQAFDGVIGKNGFVLPNEKAEGDNKTPSGIYSFGKAFGYYPFSGMKWEYQQLTDQDYWVDDPSSNQYNMWVRGKPSTGSAEKLRRSDDMHELGLVIQYNANPVKKGGGSAIFLHIWRSPDMGTAGGIAISHDSIAQVLRWIDPAQEPLIMVNYQI
jgi:L,D-peptidoglycan transpeptidase YkuD (ErfK/YbiS/YcfS/YnhG family)